MGSTLIPRAAPQARIGAGVPNAVHPAPPGHPPVDEATDAERSAGMAIGAAEPTAVMAPTRRTVTTPTRTARRPRPHHTNGSQSYSKLAPQFESTPARPRSSPLDAAIANRADRRHATGGRWRDPRSVR
jgi:hypothetical protein